MTRIVFEDSPAARLFPFDLLRPLEEIRIGILRLREKWEHDVRNAMELLHEDSTEILNEIQIKSCWLPRPGAAAELMSGRKADDLILEGKIIPLLHLWDLIELNGMALEDDFERVSRGRISCEIPTSVRVTGSGSIFVEEGAVLEHCVINTLAGPVYIGKRAMVMEGSMLRGPLSIGENAVVKMGTSIYGGTTIGDHCVTGGEIKNSILMDYSNKGHHGYLGDSVIGEWCNLGAGTSNSNVKNNAGLIRMWDEHTGMEMDASHKIGLFMGDHSRSAINTSFNSGTVVGVCCNIAGHPGLTPKYLPSFTWGLEPPVLYEFDKAIRDIEAWMKMKGKELEESQKQHLAIIFAKIQKNRP